MQLSTRQWVAKKRRRMSQITAKSPNLLFKHRRKECGKIIANHRQTPNFIEKNSQKIQHAAEGRDNTLINKRTLNDWFPLQSWKVTRTKRQSTLKRGLGNNNVRQEHEGCISIKADSASFTKWDERRVNRKFKQICFACATLAPATKRRGRATNLCGHSV